MLECPVCHHQLNWEISSESDDRIEKADAHCSNCMAVYPVMDGIGIFLTPDLPRNDMWEQVDSQVVLFLKDHPDIEKKLMSRPVEELSPTDQQFRAMVLDERGKFSDGKKSKNLRAVICIHLSFWHAGIVRLNICLRNLARLVDQSLTLLPAGVTW